MAFVEQSESCSQHCSPFRALAVMLFSPCRRASIFTRMEIVTAKALKGHSEGLAIESWSDITVDNITLGSLEGCNFASQNKQSVAS